MEPALSLNPFHFYQALGPSTAYCSRDSEEKQLRSMIDGELTAVVLGAEYSGKTSLVHRALDRSTKPLLKVSLRGLVSGNDLTSRVALSLTGIVKSIRAKRDAQRYPPSVGRHALELIKSLRLRIGSSFGSSGAQTLNLKALSEALVALQALSKDVSIVVFFDDFHEIIQNLPSTVSLDIIQELRSKIRASDNVTYIFAGVADSSDIRYFSNGYFQFDQSAKTLTIASLPRETLREFIDNEFLKGGRQLTSEALEALFLLAGYSLNELQRLSYHLWAKTNPGNVGTDRVRVALSTLLSEITERGEELLSACTPNQKTFLFAVALRGTPHLYESEFVHFSGFTAKQSVDRAVKHFTTGKHSVLVKISSIAAFRDCFMRLWILSYILRAPSVFCTIDRFDVYKESDAAKFYPYLS